MQKKVVNEFRSKTNLMGGPTTGAKRYMKLSDAIADMRPSVAGIAQYLMEGNFLEQSGMAQVRLSVNGRTDVYWPIEVITRAVESELRRFGYVLECRAGQYTARSYRSDRIP